jgi:hypothetical protein
VHISRWFAKESSFLKKITGTNTLGEQIPKGTMDRWCWRGTVRV